MGQKVYINKIISQVIQLYNLNIVIQGAILSK